MAAPQMEPTLDQWISFCETLSPYENFALIGLLFLRPHPPISILPTSEIVTQENARAAEKWSESRFRQILLFYCENYKKRETEAAFALIEKSEAVKNLVPLLVSTLAVPVGIAVAFLFWAMAKSLDDWCQRYSTRKFNGKGKYTGNFPEGEVDGFFDVTFLPPIFQFVEDPEAYPLEGYKIQVKVEAEVDGKLKVPTAKESNSIQFNSTGEQRHAFSFADTKTSSKLSGRVSRVYHLTKDDPNILSFTSNDMEVEPSKNP
jgi:hypothetical protein